jgi:cytoskeletal protein CcmA (bactofilin family)
MLRIVILAFVALGLLFRADDPTNIIPRNTLINGDVVTVTRDIQVNGEVTGDVTSWTGDIMIAGHVYGDVVSYTGSVTLLPGAQVDGSIMSLSGDLAVQEESLREKSFRGGFGGQLFSSIVGVFAPAPAIAPTNSGLARWLVSAVLGSATLVLALLLVGVWPNRSIRAAQILMRRPGRSLLIGALSAVALMALATLTAGVLAATVVALPVSALLLVLMQLPFVAGLAVLTQAARSTLQPGSHELSPLAGFTALALIAPIVLIGLISPLAALLLFYLIASPGLGAAVLTRGGHSA